jgi:DNA-binding transcriptional ArsR family regulator
MTGVKSMQRRDGDELVDPDFVKAIGHPVRVEILVECSLAPISVTEYRNKRRSRLGRQAIEHHFSVLMDCGAIEEVDSTRERGGRARFYAATARAMFSEEDFNRLPPAVRGSLSASTLSTLWERIQESLLAGTVDSYQERHLTWIPLELDEEAFLKIIGWQDEIFFRLKPTEAEAKARMAVTGEKPMHVTLAMMGFESPPPLRDHVVDVQV